MPMETALLPDTVPLVTLGLLMLPSSDCIIHSNGSPYTVNMAHVTYQCSQATYNPIIDGGANSGLASTDACMLKYTEQYADITGVCQVSLNALPLGTCAGTVQMTHGPVILILT